VQKTKDKDVAGSFDLTIGILTFNSIRTIGETLQSLNSQSLPSERWQVIIVDHGSTDGTSEVLKEFAASASNVQWLVCPGNNIAGSRQRILELSRAPWVAFIDSDVIIPSNWLEAALSRARENESASAFAGLGGPLLLCSKSPGLESLSYMQRSFFGHFGTEQMRIDQSARPVTHLPMSAAVFRRSALCEVGGFELRLKRAGEDLEMGARLTSRGLELRIFPELAVVHQLSCRGPVEWIERTFRFGRARIQVATLHPHLWSSYRTWAPLVFAGSQVAMLFAAIFAGPMWLAAGAVAVVIHFLVLFLVFAVVSDSRPGRWRAASWVAALAMCTHHAYAWGLWIETCLLPWRLKQAELKDVGFSS
jgi:glycosyltransferase involved in cell wall biosynthesis